ncbi:YybS family protein [Alkalihalobacterium chitinilyticum]|uniref:DUF2232 domain-containing protein n=1 Tax=Alkalihalobacterium chitinilyticum TaxID=2980103 RepID=A0ABT5VFA1_9BACI|nr:DUF2232 domain-containing protein [Alkalihalobacterium chitinilyticum]MDE5414143.1 DUF2232 domain-containing protein [Alkalihalobacterium chitinilyticum]
MKKTKALTEGALLAALFGIGVIALLFIPFISMVLIWFMPVPFIIYVLRHGLKPGILFWTVTLFITFIIAGLPGLPIPLLFGLGGLVAGELYRRNKSGLAVLLGGSLTYIVSIIVLFIMSIALLGIHPLHTTQELMRQSIETAESMLSGLGQDPGEQLEAFQDLIDMLGQLGPLLIILMGVTTALLTQLFSRLIVKRFYPKVPSLPPFREWTFPKSFLWYYLIVSILVLIGVPETSFIYTVLINLFPLLTFVMTIQGLSFIFYYCYVKGVPKVVPILITVFTLLLPLFLVMVRILGIIDLGFELRKRVKK